MKTILTAVLTVAMLVGCNPKKDDTSHADAETPAEATVDTTATTVTESKNEVKYACSMHPEVIGNEGEQCNKCGMDLTEPVKQ
jgi:uncharacterized lipoprotein NlpE involved in copper resistance